MVSPVSVCLLLAVTLVCTLAAAEATNWRNLEDDSHMHPKSEHGGRSGRSAKYSSEELGAAFWNTGAQNRLLQQLAELPITSQAKNVILFIGDGMSIPTLTAARIYKGQLAGLDGEEQELSFEKFPYTGLSKTYCVDSQVADSACSATAYLSGVKNNDGCIGVTGSVLYGNCTAQNDEANRISSILGWAQDAGKRTGVVTTTRVTHASPAGTYAHTANRDWENDAMVTASGWDPTTCLDIGKQLITELPGKNINVILGGGRGEFRSNNVVDEEGSRGYRIDREDLIARWQDEKAAAGVTASYVWNRDELLAVDPISTEYLLGLFEAGHTQYNLDMDTATEPTLSEMVRTAIEILEQSPEGYFLFVEGGRIDHAHHDTRAHKALDETVQMALAVEVATSLTNVDDTLIVVTSDHAHTMSISGYPARGNPIFSATEISQSDNLPYATLSYANGPGYKEGGGGPRYDLSLDDLTAINYEFPTMVPGNSETHGGDDVAVFARGPWAHLFTGVYEQNYIPHAMAYASCLGSGETLCAVPVRSNSVH